MNLFSVIRRPSCFLRCCGTQPRRQLSAIGSHAHVTPSCIHAAGAAPPPPPPPPPPVVTTNLPLPPKQPFTSTVSSIATDISALAHAVCNGDRVALSHAITLIESTHADHRQKATQLMSHVLAHRRHIDTISSPQAHKRLRVGISGPPGVGKSTFIEALGTYIIDHYRGEDVDPQNLNDPFKTATAATTTPLFRQEGLEPPLKNHTVAVLSVDPSSHLTGGSILGDKTRMTSLIRAHDRCYIRPSPSKGRFGGVAPHTSEAIFLCESAGYDVILVETVGVGQSEVDVCDMVDIMILLVSPTSGNELQSMKKGVVEMADLIVVNRADGDLIKIAKQTQSEYQQAIQIGGQTHCDGWRTPVLLCSSTHTDVSHMKYAWDHILLYEKHAKSTGHFYKRRASQGLVQMWRCADEQISLELRTQAQTRYLQDTVKEVSNNVQNGTIPPVDGAAIIVTQFFNNVKSGRHENTHMATFTHQHETCHCENDHNHSHNHYATV